MPLPRQLFARSLGEVLAGLAKQLYPSAKHIARAWALDRSTAENLCKGHLSIPTLVKALAAEEAHRSGGGWALWEAIGTELLGEDYHAYEERKLRAVIQRAEEAHENLVRLRARREALAERAAEQFGDEGRRNAERLG